MRGVAAAHETYVVGVREVVVRRAVREAASCFHEQRNVASGAFVVALFVRIEVAVKHASSRQGARVSGQDGGTSAQRPVRVTVSSE